MHLVCSQGHRWDPAGRPVRPGDRDLHCPVCGDLPLAEGVEEVAPSHPADPLAVRQTFLSDGRPSGQTGMSDVQPGPQGNGISWASVDLGPKLPMAVFTSTEIWHPERIGALALYCSDGRWGEACDEFCHRCLQTPRYDRWAIPGGPGWRRASTATTFTRPPVTSSTSWCESMSSSASCSSPITAVRTTETCSSGTPLTACPLKWRTSRQRGDRCATGSRACARNAIWPCDGTIAFPSTG